MANPNVFNSIKVPRPNRNVFDLSHDVKLTFDMGQLVPVCIQECIPGDLFKMSSQTLVRFAPLVSPAMHRFDATIHYFFVPNRIVWEGWQDWIGGDDNLVPPYLNYQNSNYDTFPLIDYMGLPKPAVETGVVQVSALPFAAYQAIYNEYYRDENLVPEVATKLASGNNSANGDWYRLRRRAWMHDYFTSALPFAQKGAAVELPLGNLTDVPVRRLRPEGQDPQESFVTWDATATFDGGSTGPAFPPVNAFADESDDLVALDGAGTLFAKTSDANLESTTINDLRRAYALQRFLEKLARGGSRYTEIVYAHFGVKSADARLQRPEYITGVKTPIIISEVLNTTGETDGLPQGNMAGHGVGFVDGNYGSFYCQEHGFIIGIMSVLPVPAYQQGVPRHYIRNDRYDYFWPDFAHIGEQPVFNKEIYVDSVDPDGTFGYVPRYSEYRYNPSRVAGQFKTSLDFWHMGRIFANEPQLNQQFIECDPGKRIFSVDSAENSLYVNVFNRISAVRSIPKFGTPMF